MNAKRLQQILEYAQALKVMAQLGRGNVRDTADIVTALQDLQAFQQFRPHIAHVAGIADKPDKPPNSEQNRKVA